MITIWIAFITGLTTGGLGCLALQGGLLTSSLARQAETDALRGKRSGPAAITATSGMSGASIARTILLFLGAKTVAHAVLGFFLGALGAFLRLNALTRALLQFGIGVFMIGNALRMLNVHPIFRYFAFEPPAQITRYVRRTSKREASFALPIFLGVLTVLIPCGISQTMMMAAMGTGNAWMGASLMAAFTLGTCPVFFGVAYSAMRIGAKLEHTFMRVVAVVMVLFGLVALESGLNLMGSPLSASRLARSLRDDGATTSVVLIPTQVAPEPTTVSQEIVMEPAGDPIEPDITPTPAPPEKQTIYVQAMQDSYLPPRQRALANVPAELVFITDFTRSCTRALVIRELGVETYLAESGRETFEVPPMAPGAVLRFSCSAGIYTGEIIFE